MLPLRACLNPRNRFAWSLLAVTALALAALFYYPLASVLVAALGLPTESDAPFFWRVAHFTYGQALLSAVLSAVVGLPGAVLFAESRGRSRQVWAALSLVPFSLPPILVVLGLLGVWGRQGLLGPSWGENYDGIYGWTGILLAHTLFNFPLFVRLVGQALQVGDRAEEKSALALGLPRWRCFVWVTWPKIRAAFGSAFVLAFLFSASSFLVVLLLGGGPAFTSIEVAIFQAIKQDLTRAWRCVWRVYRWQSLRCYRCGVSVPLHPLAARAKKIWGFTVFGNWGGSVPPRRATVWGSACWWACPCFGFLSRESRSGASFRVSG